jgi:hypothetical protein
VEVQRRARSRAPSRVLDGISAVVTVVVDALTAVLAGPPFVVWVLRTDLDLMQTTPVFVYLIPLIPAVFFFGIGVVPGVVATTIFSIDRFTATLAEGPNRGMWGRLRSRRAGAVTTAPRDAETRTRAEDPVPTPACPEPRRHRRAGPHVARSAGGG